MRAYWNAVTCICALAVVLFAGCAQQHALTSPTQPGPVVGQAAGTGVGVIAGNVVGFGAGAAEGLVKGAAAPFNNTTRVIRRWKTETTPDGRTIKVPVDTFVDASGRTIVVKPSP